MFFLKKFFWKIFDFFWFFKKIKKIFFLNFFFSKINLKIVNLLKFQMQQSYLTKL